MALASPALPSTRPVPQNLEAERALLSGMLFDNRKIDEVITLIPQQAQRSSGGVRTIGGTPIPSTDEPLFSHPANQEIFETILDLYARERAVDLTTLGAELDRLGRFEAVGGAPYLGWLEEEMVTTIYLPEYARIVVEKWRLRSLLRVAESIADEVRRSEDEVDQILDRSEQKIFDLSQQMESRDFVHVEEIAPRVMMNIEARAKQGATEVTGLATGFKDLDNLTTGLHPSNLIILAARPSMGKSALAMNIATNVAVRHGKPVGIFSLEMSREELNQRLLCTLARVSMRRVRENRLSHSEIGLLHDQTIRLGNSPLYLDDSSNLSILELRSRSRRLKKKVPQLSLIIVDYLQLMSGPNSRTENRQQEVSAVSRALKGLARDLEIPVLALSQLSRQIEQRGGRTLKDQKPKLSDLRESGAIEQDADVVMFIQRDFNKTNEKGSGGPAAKPEAELARVYIGKQRNGPTGEFDLLFFGDRTEFVDVVHSGSAGGRG